MSDHTMCSRCNEKPAAICISCLTDCTDLKQPKVGDFTKEKIEVRIFEARYWVNAKDWNKLRDRLDSSEARNKDLLAAGERVTLMFGCQRLKDAPKCKKGDMCCVCAIEAAIAKAKKEG